MIKADFDSRAPSAVIDVIDPSGPDAPDMLAAAAQPSAPVHPLDPPDLHGVPPAELEALEPSEAEVVQAFRRVMHMNRQLMVRILGPEGAHPGQAACLRVLVQNDGIAQRELAGKLLVSAPTTTTMLQRMERAGLVARRVDPADQRLTRVYVAPRGRRLEAEVRRIMADTLHRVLGPMTVEDRLELARLLRAMADNTREVLG